MKIIRLIRVPNNYTFFLILYGILLALSLSPYYTQGCLILGGEGDYVLDFSTHLRKFGFAWHPYYGTGLPNMSPCGTGLNILVLLLIEKLTGSASITNFALIFSIYFFPFFAMYLVCKAIKARPLKAFMISLFYVVNPFTLYYLSCINQWNVFTVTLMPLFLWIMLKYYHNDFKLFFLFGFISTCFSFTYQNPPLLGIILISIPLSIFMVSYYHNGKVLLTQILRKYSILLVSFIVFNSWWILPFFAGTVSTAQKMYTYSFARSWLDTTVNDHSPIIAKMFSLIVLIGGDSAYDFFTYWYNTNFARLITLVPIFIIGYYFLIADKKKIRNLLNWAILSMLLIVLFFVKGNASPFGFIYNFMFEHLPFFYIFKSPVEKFGILYVFILSVLLSYIMIDIKNHKYYKHIFGVFTAYLLFCSIPIFTGNIIPDYKIEGYGYASRKYKDKVEYKQVRELINNNNSQYKILSLPGRDNYQVCMTNYNNKKYTGLDPVLMNINKPFIAPHHEISLLYNEISSVNYEKILGIYNIGKIMINEDLLPWFGTEERETVPELKEIFNRIMTSNKWGSITLYNNQDYFLPHIYISTSPLIIDGNIGALTSLVETEYLDGKPALFFNTQKENKGLKKRKDIPKLVFSHNEWKLLETVTAHNSSLTTKLQEPEITFKKINPTKYLVKVKKAENPFWLVFSESFHKEWRLYQLPITNYQLPGLKEIIADYPKLRVKEAKHLMKFEPSDVKYLFRKALTDNHYLVNSYANGWYIDPQELGLDENFKLVLYFWPQSLFYLGLGILGLTLMGCTGYLGFDLTRKKFINEKNS